MSMLNFDLKIKPPIGHVTLRVLDQNGLEHTTLPFFNLITNTGKNWFLDTFFNRNQTNNASTASTDPNGRFFTYNNANAVVVSTTTNEVTSTTTALPTQRWISTNVTKCYWSNPSTNIYRHHIQNFFTLGAVVGTIASVGRSDGSASSGLIAGTRIKDSLGNPTTLTLTSSDQLVIDYVFEFDISNLNKTIEETITINGIDVDVTHTCEFGKFIQLTPNTGCLLTYSVNDYGYTAGSTWFDLNSSQQSSAVSNSYPLLRVNGNKLPESLVNVNAFVSTPATSQRRNHGRQSIPAGYLANGIETIDWFGRKILDSEVEFYPIKTTFSTPIDKSISQTLLMSIDYTYGYL